MRNTLTARFQLDSHVLNQMRVTSKNGQYSSRRVEYLRIFDPSLVGDGGAASLRYEDLAETNGQRKALLFEGHIEKGDLSGRVNLTDRRIP